MANRQDGGFLRDSSGALVISGAGNTRATLGAPAQIITHRAANPGLWTTTGTTNTEFNSRIHHVAAADCTAIRLVYSNWDAAEAAGPNSIPIKCSVEAADGTVIPVSFNGVRTFTLESGFDIVSDPVGLALKQGDVFWTRTHVTLPSAGQTLPNNTGANLVDGEGGTSGTVANDKSDSGTVTAGNTSAFGPNAVLGHAQASVPSVAIRGDSIILGGNDLKNDYGWAIRALETRPYGVVRMGRGGETAQTAAAFSTGHRRQRLSAMAKYVLCNYGVNDVFSGRTLAQVQADLLTLWTQGQRAGQVVYQTTITPRTTSTDSWTTVANQTTVSSAQDTVRQNLNAWLRAGAPIDATSLAAVAVGTSGALVAGSSSHPLAGFFEIADIYESARNSGKIAAPGRTGTGDISTGSPTILNATGNLQLGDLVIATGIPSGTMVSAGAGTSTITLTANATATTVGLALASAYTADGSHPYASMQILMAAGVDTTKFT